MHTQVKETAMTAVMLIVPDTAYHKRVPVLLGTNVLCHFKSETDLKDPVWGTALTLLAKQQALTNTTDPLGPVTIGKPLTIPPNGHMVVHGHTRIQPVCHLMTVCVEGGQQGYQREFWPLHA